jgi:tartrate dehydratase alpha subunit/fumarate hydratase class I-like protein
MIKIKHRSNTEISAVELLKIFCNIKKKKDAACCADAGICCVADTVNNIKAYQNWIYKFLKL